MTKMIVGLALGLGLACSPFSISLSIATDVTVYQPGAGETTVIIDSTPTPTTDSGSTGGVTVYQPGAGETTPDSTSTPTPDSGSTEHSATDPSIQGVMTLLTLPTTDSGDTSNVGNAPATSTISSGAYTLATNVSYVVSSMACTSATVMTLPAPLTGGGVVLDLEGARLGATALDDNTQLRIAYRTTPSGVMRMTPIIAQGSAHLTVGSTGQAMIGIDASRAAVSGSADTVISVSYDPINGLTEVAVESGSLVLPGATRSLATAQVGDTIFAGERMSWNNAGEIARVWLGSTKGTAGMPGDPFVEVSDTRLELRELVVPHLAGTVARTGRSFQDDLSSRLQSALGMRIQGQQNTVGAIELTGGGRMQTVLPVGSLSIDLSRADGVVFSRDGLLEVVERGIVTTLAPGMADYAGFAGSMALREGVTMVKADGRLEIHLGDTIFVARPAWSVESCDKPGLNFTDAGVARGVAQYGSGGRCQTLYPAVADLEQIRTIIAGMDANGTAQVEEDASITLRINGQTFRIRATYELSDIPAAHSKEAFWVDDGGRLFIRYPESGKVQAFTFE